MATFTFGLQGTTPTTIDATDKLQFANGVFDGKITVDEYNASTHVKTAANADKSASNTPNNNKFISQAGGTAGDSQADWGDGTEDLDAIASGEAALKINFADAESMITEDAIFYAYDGSTPATPPSGLDVRAAEVGDANFTEAEGSGSAFALTDQGAGTSHDFFIVLSASPTSVGAKTGKVRIELTYS
jgi:hypothetical protein